MATAVATAPPHEQTPLLGSTLTTNELVDQSPLRPYKKQNRCFHIIATAAITLIVALAVGVTVYFLFLRGQVEPDSILLYQKVAASDYDYNRAQNNDDFNVLLESSWPRMDALIASYPATSYITVIEDAVKQGKEQLKKSKNETQSQSENNSSTTENSEEGSTSNVTQSTTEKDSPSSSTGSGNSTTEDRSSAADTASKLSDYGYIENEATKYLRGKNLYEVINYNATKDLKWTNETGCFRLSENITCKESPYRTLDGFCNNMDNPRWGNALRPYRRALPADYADGLSVPRGGFDSSLPSALDISAQVKSSHNGHKRFSEMLSVWGDFINHDVSIAAKYTRPDGKLMDCCQSENKSVECFPVIGNSTEEQNQTCFDFIRSMAALRCSFGPREQLNEVSSFLDGSLVYGNTEYLGSELRTFEDGLLDLSPRQEGDIWIPPIRSAVEGYDPEASWAASFDPERTFRFMHDSEPWPQYSWRSTYDPELSSHSSHNPMGAWKPTYDPDGPWRLSYDSDGQWRESYDHKALGSSADERGSWRSWYHKEVPWVGSDDREESWSHRGFSHVDAQNNHGIRKFYSPLGDIRPSEYAQAAAMRSVIVRQHNRIARALRVLHPDWNDESIYQESKRIVNAQMQHITYNEFLPNILGEDMMQRLKLSPEKEGYWTRYNKSIDPTVSNQFAVASSRLARAAIQRQLAKEPEAEKWEQEILENIKKNVHKIESDLEKTSEDIKNGSEYWYKRAYEIVKGNLDSVVKGILNNNNSTEKSENATTTSTENSSTTMSTTTESTQSTTESATESKKEGRKKRSAEYDLDSTSYDIQKGRDHGLPGYTEWRKYCNLSEVNSFGDLRNIFNREALKNISQIYRTVYDIDLYTGALAENPIPGGVVGPTSACLLADQYYRMKHGDRYWYETQEKPQAFTQRQLNEIRKTSLAGILCANVDHLTHAPTRIMWVIDDENNKLVPCANIQQPDLSHWGSSTSYPDVVGRDEIKKLEQEFQRYKPHLDKFESNVNSSKWTSTLEPTAANSALPGYVVDWISNRSSQVDTVLNYELQRLQASNSSLYDKSNQLDLCNITVQTRHVEIFRKKKLDFKPPREILVNVFHNQMLVWSPNASDSLTYGFKIVNRTGDFSLDVHLAAVDEANCIKLKPECVYYSKVVLGDLVDERDLFEVSVSTVADPCSVIAPVLMQGYYVDEDTFYWTGGITIYTAKGAAYLNKEEELSFSSQVEKSWLSLPRLNGTLTIRDHGKWDGHLPVVLDTAALSWYSTKDTLVYPISWSGFYEGSTFEGVFLLPQKQGENIKWYDGEFSIILPHIVPTLFKEMIRANRVYSSVVYLTSNPAGVDRFDVSEFQKIHDWVFADYSQILITGQFDEKGRFHWNGDISIHISPLGVDYPSTTYRPFGKYLFKILEADLFAQLGSSGNVEKWWSGVLPSKTIVPSGAFDDRLNARVLDEYIIWSYNNFTATDGNATFTMYQSRSQVKLWGGFEFQFAFLMDAIWTSTLQQNVTYYSPILLQYDRMTYDFGDDMPERILLNYHRPDFGVLAPITLLGEFYNRTSFAWNRQVLVTVIEK